MKTTIKAYVILIILCVISKNTFSQVPPETDWHPVEFNLLSHPGYLETIHDAVNNINVTRITDVNTFNSTSEVIPPYSKIQAWNSDMTKIFVGFSYILNASDYSIYKELNIWGKDSRWSNVNPNIRYLATNDNQFVRLNIETNERLVLHVFSGFSDISIGPFEGNISANDKYVVVTDKENRATLYDIKNNREVSTRFFSGGFDWATITPSGNYIAVSDNATHSVRLYDLEFNFLRSIGIKTEHADFAVDVNGDEVLVQVIPLSMARLSDGHFTDLLSDSDVCGNPHFNPNIAGHISGRNFKMPGWALVSTSIGYSCDYAYNYRTEIFAIKLDGSGKIRNYGYSYTSYDNYNSQTKAIFSPDGTKVMFASDWGVFGAAGNTTAYIAEYSGTSLPVEEVTIEGLSLYPNPTTNKQLQISNLKGEELELSIYDITGRKVYKDKISGQKYSINLKNLSKGVYFLKIFNAFKKEVKNVKVILN